VPLSHTFTIDPLLTARVHETLLAARHAGGRAVCCSLDLERSTTTVEVSADGWCWQGRRFPFLQACRQRTIYHWAAGSFRPVARFTNSLIKLVPTRWGPPTFEIDGIKMLPTANVSPYEDAERKVGLIEPRGKVILDTCGGLGYFAACCLRGQALHVYSYEVNPDVIWLRTLNPWSPGHGGEQAMSPALTLTQADVVEQVAAVGDESVDAVLHDPPRFAIAGQLYSQQFYHHLARVLRRRGRLFHYTGAPNSRSRGRELAAEVSTRLRRAGLSATLHGDGVLAVKTPAA
jgi:predicted methyltransferase